MHTLIALLLAVGTACAVPRPMGPSEAPGMVQFPRAGRFPRPFRTEYILPRMLMPNPLYTYDDTPRGNPNDPENDWLNKEIDLISQMDDDEDLTPFEEEFTRWVGREPTIPRTYGPIREPSYLPVTPAPEEVRPIPPPRELAPPETLPAPQAATQQRDISTKTPTVDKKDDNKKKTFALTPLDKEYYEPEDKIVSQKASGPHEGGELKSHKALNLVEFQAPRQIRQNPNLGRTKNLVAENLDRLRIGLTPETADGTDKPRHIHVLESAADPADSIYGIALIAAVGTALTMAIIGFAFGWYTLSKKAKAAADVDYPAYGVTGPNIDTSGDRKLAHSAHMYHYQHQKQQIIAMERNGCEHRNGSVSDPESEEENEEGDYTVYECPGFATTGEMEVKNPLFSEDPTPATPGKCEIVKPQPKD
uniref:Neural proliferation differentiation and control protein 1 n=1 Tax=Heliothis virescens TaxID=7102 RepID=A0A2A4JWA5_HELVI